MEKKEQVNQKDSKKKKLLWLLLLLLLVVGGYFVYDRFFSEEMPVSVVSGDFLPDGKDASKMTDEEIASYAKQVADASQFNMRIVSEATIDQNSMTGDLRIQNPPSNSQPVNVVVTLDSTGQTVYESGAIQPGEEITQATLTESLASGTYTATATFNIYNPDTNRKQGEVQSVLTLMVQ